MTNRQFAKNPISVGKIFLLPSPLADEEEHAFSIDLINRYKSLKYFAVENIRTTRRWLKRIDRSIDIDLLTFFVLHKNTSEAEIQEILKTVKEGIDIGVVSEAGCPGIADPGSSLVRAAHRSNIQIWPLAGPSSIFLALMASGLNGQSFCFLGYLPVKKDALNQMIKSLNQTISNTGQTQIFIETPYRNMALFNTLISRLPEDVQLCIACNIGSKDQFIFTQSIYQWKNGTPPDLHKKPAVFLLGKNLDLI